LWIRDSADIETQLAGGPDVVPLPCSHVTTTGPSDLLDIFPQDLVEWKTRKELGDLPAFGRLQGVIKDPHNRYVVVNIFARDGGYVGVIGAQTKEAVALFCATEFDFGSGLDRSVHMIFWNADGSAIIVRPSNASMSIATFTAKLLNRPLPTVIFEEDYNTATGGNLNGVPENLSGRNPGQTIRRDSHGAAPTLDGNCSIASMW
jgi:hypothetical protein